MAENFQSINQEVIANTLSSWSTANETKTQILDAYLKIAVKEGTTALSLTRLADELKISKQLVRYHIPDLDQAALELFRITARKGAEYTQSRIEAAKTWDEKLLAWVDAMFDWVVAYPDFAKFLLFMYHRASVDPEVNALHKQIVLTGRNRLSSILNHSSKKKIQQRSTQLTLILHQLLTASLIEMLSMDDIKNQARYKKDFKISAALIIGQSLE